MIISNSNKYIFVHIHKAAGTSIHFALDDSLAWNDIAIGSTPYGEQIQKPYYNRFNLQKHSSAQEIRDLVGDDIWSDYFTFTFVRHPYRRAVSLYKYIRMLVNKQGKKRYLRHLPMTRFQSNIWEWPATRAFIESRTISKFIRHRYIQRAVGAKPQYQSIINEHGDIIVDFIGKVEQIEEDFLNVTDKIGLPDTTLERRNQSYVGNSHPPLLKESDYDYLYKYYKEDFDIFGYDPGLRI